MGITDPASIGRELNQYGGRLGKDQGVQASGSISFGGSPKTPVAQKGIVEATGTVSIQQDNRANRLAFQIPGTFDHTPSPKAVTGEIKVGGPQNPSATPLKRIDYTASRNTSREGAAEKSRAFIHSQELSDNVKQIAPGRTDDITDTNIRVNGNDDIEALIDSGTVNVTASGQNNTFQSLAESGGRINVRNSDAFSQFTLNGKNVDFGDRKNAQINIDEQGNFTVDDLK